MRTQFDRQVIRFMIAELVEAVRIARTKRDIEMQKKHETDLNRVFSQRHRIGYTKNYTPVMYW